MGNSEGAGVITSSKSRIMGIGPDEIEVESDFVPGNSGGPVINEAEQVVGIATYIKNPVDKPDWAKKDTRYEKPRRFTIRPTRVKDWMLANKTDFYKDHLQIEGLWYLYLQCEWAYQMLNEGKGFVSTLPSSWNKDIKQILNNHNKRQLRPDAKETVRYGDY